MVDHDSTDPDDTIIPEDDPNKTVEFDETVEIRPQNETIDVRDHDADTNEPVETDYDTVDPDDYRTVDSKDSVKRAEDKPPDPHATWDEGS